jgi:hypothetical protein
MRINPIMGSGITASTIPRRIKAKMVFVLMLIVREFLYLKKGSKWSLSRVAI